MGRLLACALTLLIRVLRGTFGCGDDSIAICLR